MTQQGFNEIVIALSEDRDSERKLRVPYFRQLGMAYKSKRGKYDSDEFKAYIRNSGVLKGADFLPDGLHAETWRHRVDRVTQKINTDV